MAKYKYKLNEMSKTASAEKAEKELGTPKRKFEVGQVTISDDGTTKSTVNNINKETGAISWTVENLPGFDLLYSELNDLVDISKRVYVKTKEDKRFRSFYEEVRKLRNSLRTHLRNEYPDDYKRILRLSEDDVDEASMSGAAGSYLTPYAFRKKGQKADDEAYKQIGYKLVKEKLSIAGKEVEKIDKKGNDPENWVVKYKDGSEESYLKHLNEALNPFDRIDRVLRKAERREPKFKRGDEVDYLGTKAKIRSSKYNSFDKSFDYTVEYRDENNQRTSADGVKGNDLKTSVRENEIGNKINIARAKSHFKQGEKIAAINKKTEKVTKIKDANQFGSFNSKEYDFAYLNESKDPGADLGPGPKAGPDGVTDSAYTKQFKYKLVPKNKQGTYVQKGSSMPVRKLWGE